MAILCDRCNKPMVKFRIEDEFSSGSDTTSGSQAPRGAFGFSGTKPLSSAAEFASSSKGQIYYKCEKCHRIKIIPE